MLKLFHAVRILFDPPSYNLSDHVCTNKCIVGLNYFHAHRFRSRAVIEFGDPITISADMVKKFKEGGNTKRDTCSKLLDIIYNALKSVTVNASNYETLMVNHTLNYVILGRKSMVAKLFLDFTLSDDPSG
jgi:hypothetical protein